MCLNVEALTKNFLTRCGMSRGCREHMEHKNQIGEVEKSEALFLHLIAIYLISQAPNFHGTSLFLILQCCVFADLGFLILTSTSRQDAPSNFQ